MAHEIGHMIGLGHSDFAGSVMKTDSSADESWFRGTIDADRVDMYRELYGHGR